MQGHHTQQEIDHRSGKAARDQYLAAHNVDTAAYRDVQAVVKKSKWDVFVEAAGELIKGLIGWDDIRDCVTQGAFGACVRTVINFIPWGKILKAGEIIADFWKGAKALITFGKEVAKAEKVIVDTEKVLVDAERAADAAADAQQAVSKVAHGAEEAKGAAAAANSAEDAASACLKHSFVAGTKVLLADGSAKPIERVVDGNVVKTFDPATGVAGQHRVVGTLVHGDEEQRTEVTLDSGGTLVTTDWHPVWVEEAGGWAAIGSLVSGEHLHSADGRSVEVKSVRHFGQRDSVFDLTVDSVHDYYVLAGADSLLVHNCGPDIDKLSENAKQPVNPKVPRGASNASRAYQKHMVRPNSSLPSIASGSARRTAAHDRIDDVLTDPRSALQSWTHPQHGPVYDFLLPDGGARWSQVGDFIGFLE